MGLDMYLTASRFVSGYDFRGEQQKALYRSILDATGATAYADPETPHATVKITVGYWRKANQIHHWFVTNVQNGVDECEEHGVSREQLKQLRDLCAAVLEVAKVAPGPVSNGTVYQNGVATKQFVEAGVITNAETVAAMLPTAEGFFFGSTEYTEYYLDDLRETVKIVDRALTMPDEWDFEYRSSW